MPTVILLDVSLSMNRPVNTGDKLETITRHQLAIAGIETFLDYLSSNYKQEFVSLIIFSQTHQQLVPFTREYNEIKKALLSLDEMSICNLEVGLEAAGQIILNEWGSNVMSQILLVTDGRIGIGRECLPSYLKRLKNSKDEIKLNKFLYPFTFPCKLLVMCLSIQSMDHYHDQAITLYKQLISYNNSANKGEVFTSDKSLTTASVRELFNEMTRKHLACYLCALKCGNLKCTISVFPDPNKCCSQNAVNKTLWSDFEICGFLNTADVSSPPFVSKHLILPTPDSNSNSDDKELSDKLSIFTVLLHGSLKVENMVAVVQISDAWFGVMYSHADSKKKSNLILNCFAPGTHPIPWLGDFKNLGPIKDLAKSPYLDNKSPFPVTTCDRKSYSQNCVVWIHNAGLQGDIQKILRNARKLPEKQTQFYKELNRLKRAVLAIGFFDLFESLASLLDRERTLLASHSHPSAALQMSHASKVLRSPQAYDINQSIIPLQINIT